MQTETIPVVPRNKGGRPKTSNKVLFAQRLTPDQIKEVEAVLKAQKPATIVTLGVGMDKGPNEPISQIKGLAEPKDNTMALLDDIERLETEKVALEGRIQELVFGNPNPQIVLMRQEIAKLKAHILRLEG